MRNTMPWSMWIWLRETGRNPGNICVCFWRKRIWAGPAGAVAAGGDVILLDEPYGGLDGESRRRVERYLHAFGACSAVLLATHVEENAVQHVE